jgi:heme exporter protein C
MGTRINWFYFAAPSRCYRLAQALQPWLLGAAVVLGAWGFYLGLWQAPTDAQQGEVYRIVFVHVPAAWMSMVIYLAMAGWAAAGLIWQSRLSHMMAQALAPTGALMTFVALWTGALWGQPTWGTWWVWDARLTSELLLLFLYLGYMALHASIEDAHRADRAASLLAIVGAINVPVIYFSVVWWNTLHQGASIGPSGSRMAEPMLHAMLIMVAAAWCYTLAAVLARLRLNLLRRERHTTWAQRALHEQESQA